MRRDCLKLKLSDPHSVSVSSSFHGSESDDDSSKRSSRSSRSSTDNSNIIHIAMSATQVSIIHWLL